MALQIALDVRDKFGDEGLDLRDDGVGGVDELSEFGVDGFHIAFEEGGESRDLRDEFLQLGDDLIEELNQLSNETSARGGGPARAGVAGRVGLVGDVGDASASLMDDLLALGELGLHALNNLGGVGGLLRGRTGVQDGGVAPLDDSVDAADGVGKSLGVLGIVATGHQRMGTGEVLVVSGSSGEVELTAGGRGRFDGLERSGLASEEVVSFEGLPRGNDGRSADDSGEGERESANHFDVFFVFRFKEGKVGWPCKGGK